MCPTNAEIRSEKKQESNSSSTADISSKVDDHHFWLRPDCIDLFETEINNKPTTSSCTRVGKRARMLRFAINHAWKVRQRYPEAQFLEFGVAQGKDLLRMAAFIAEKERQECTAVASSSVVLHGFDSFEGLPEAWDNGQYCNDSQQDALAFDVGKFNLGGIPPRLQQVQGSLQMAKHGNNCCQVEFHVGWFADTVPAFLTVHQHPIAFIHADADLYSSTICFLQEICHCQLLVKGSVVVFDEYWNYQNWQEGEYKAWQEICQEFGIEFQYLSYHGPSAGAGKKLNWYGYQSVSVVVTRVSWRKEQV